MIEDEKTTSTQRSLKSLKQTSEEQHATPRTRETLSWDSDSSTDTDFLEIPVPQWVFEILYPFMEEPFSPHDREAKEGDDDNCMHGDTCLSYPEKNDYEARIFQISNIHSLARWAILVDRQTVTDRLLKKGEQAIFMIGFTDKRYGRVPQGAWLLRNFDLLPERYMEKFYGIFTHVLTTNRYSTQQNADNR